MIERSENTNIVMKKDNRDVTIKFRVSQAEYEAIERKFRNSGLRSRSEFIRTMIFEGMIVQISEDELKKIYRLVNNIASNVNQIAVRANSTGKRAVLSENHRRCLRDVKYV